MLQAASCRHAWRRSHSRRNKTYIYTLAIQPTLTYGAHAIHLKKTDLQLLEKAHARIIKTSLVLSKFSKTNPLLTALKTQRLESVVKVQTLNLLRRCMSGDSLASMFYWTIYKRGDTEGNTLMCRSHTILQQYGLVKPYSMIFLESITKLL